MQEQLLKLKQAILDQLGRIKDINLWRELETKYMGRKGEFTEFLRGLASLSDEDKRTIGRLANETKKELEGKFAEVRSIIEGVAEAREADITLPGAKMDGGHLHPLTIVQNELEDLFSSMGFMILDGPELESDFYNFEALNIPKFHPARDMQDTFYVDKKNKEGEYDLVMRTQTSPVQVRGMLKYGAPLRCVAPGRTFRSENIDAGHDHTFYQMEGLMIDKDISLANLIAIMRELLNSIFKRKVNTRIRPGYFPFVEPGIELDFECAICGGKGCPTCKHSGWVELLPAGMVHPNVLRYGGIDPNIYSGFAFGLGLTRLVMMKYGIDDIRLMNSGDFRFLKQF